MVHIVDEGSVYDAPVDRVWKLGQAHQTDSGKIHPGFLNYNSEPIAENTDLRSWETEMQGRRVKNRAKFTLFPPVGEAIEILEGPLAGSKCFNYYTPKGPNQTAVTVVGDFKSPMLPEAQVKQAVLQFLEQAFNEDTAYLKTMR